MKKAILYILFVCPVYAAHYDIIANIYTPALTLQTGDSLFMTNGGFGSLTLFGNSTAIIEGTATLSEGSGGIWYLAPAGTSHLDFIDGEVHQLIMNTYATAILKGGRIDEIWTYQGAGYPYIDLYCRTWDYHTTTKILTGIWNTDNDNDGQWDPFSIQLVDVQGYVPTFNNINIIEIPEPASLVLFGLGGWLLRRR